MFTNLKKKANIIILHKLPSCYNDLKLNFVCLKLEFVFKYCSLFLR